MFISLYKYLFFRLNVGQLPAWAKTKLATENNFTNPGPPQAPPKGRWASRAGSGGGNGDGGGESSGGGGGRGVVMGGEDSASSVKDGSSLEWAR